MSAELRIVGHFTVDAGDPCLDGHFPGNPLVPGVVLLDRAFACIAAGRPLRIETAKFTAPVPPGVAIAVACRTAADRIHFTCSLAGVPVLTPVLTGAARFADAGPAP